MRVAKVSKEDLGKVWAVYRALGILESVLWGDNHRQRRAEKLLAGRIQQLGQGGLIRVAAGCETLISHCCDPNKDHYDFSPQILEAIHPYDCTCGE